MCDLCNSMTEDRARAELRNEAERLRRLAVMLDNMADGRIRPHTDSAETLGSIARNVIRYLVDEWM
jgi:transposase